MKIWVDADACPVVIKEILFRAAERSQIMVVLVANQTMDHPASNFVRAIRVAKGFDVADDEIVKQVEEGDLVITSDIPLAAEVLEKKAHALSPRGERFTTDTIKAQLTMRDFMDSLRASGTHTGGPAKFSHTDRQNFANQLDRLISKAKKQT